MTGSGYDPIPLPMRQDKVQAEVLMTPWPRSPHFTPCSSRRNSGYSLSNTVFLPAECSPFIVNSLYFMMGFLVAISQYDIISGTFFMTLLTSMCEYDRSWWWETNIPIAKFPNSYLELKHWVRRVKPLKYGSNDLTHYPTTLKIILIFP